jgi:hypothetical protein
MATMLPYTGQEFLASLAPGGPADVYAHVTKETDAGIRVTADSDVSRPPIPK